MSVHVRSCVTAKFTRVIRLRRARLTVVSGRLGLVPREKRWRWRPEWQYQRWLGREAVQNPTVRLESSLVALYERRKAHVGRE